MIGCARRDLQDSANVNGSSIWRAPFAFRRQRRDLCSVLRGFDEATRASGTSFGLKAQAVTPIGQRRAPRGSRSALPGLPSTKVAAPAVTRCLRRSSASGRQRMVDESMQKGSGATLSLLVLLGQDLSRDCQQQLPNSGEPSQRRQAQAHRASQCRQHQSQCNRVVS